MLYLRNVRRPGKKLVPMTAPASRIGPIPVAACSRRPIQNLLKRPLSRVPVSVFVFHMGSRIVRMCGNPTCFTIAAQCPLHVDCVEKLVLLAAAFSIVRGSLRSKAVPLRLTLRRRALGAE